MCISLVINTLQYDARYIQRHINTLQYYARHIQRHINTLQYDARYTQRQINSKTVILNFTILNFVIFRTVSCLQPREGIYFNRCSIFMGKFPELFWFNFVLFLRENKLWVNTHKGIKRLSYATKHHLITSTIISLQSLWRSSATTQTSELLKVHIIWYRCYSSDNILKQNNSKGNLSDILHKSGEHTDKYIKFCTL